MTTLKIGSKGGDVKTLQTALNKYGHGLTVDGVFGAKTETAVKNFQKANELSVDGIVGAKTWSKLGYETADEVTPGGRTINKLIVHCTATPEGEDYSIDSINNSHKARNFSYYIDPDTKEKRHIGYHYIIQRDGTIVRCRPENVRGCHTSNHNYDSIGISYIGGCPERSVKDWDKKGKDTRTEAQKASIVKLLKELKGRYRNAEIYGHRDFAAKACPSFDARTEYKHLSK
ncbi:MAG: N-acetylmuramoyl-L-alanine amidase [Muribaculaceae bacterium]|nr:N-acetylmuramoyl-L-alanine amidase [Muribaculaceae bacterium]